MRYLPALLVLALGTPVAALNQRWVGHLKSSVDGGQTGAMLKLTVTPFIPTPGVCVSAHNVPCEELPSVCMGEGTCFSNGYCALEPLAPCSDDDQCPTPTGVPEARSCYLLPTSPPAVNLTGTYRCVPESLGCRRRRGQLTATVVGGELQGMLLLGGVIACDVGGVATGEAVGDLIWGAYGCPFDDGTFVLRRKR